MKNKFAPIVLFVYNRPRQTELTLKALKLNHNANESNLYIFCDGPKPNSNAENLQRVKAVREIIRKEKWCKNVMIIEAEKNKGLAKSIIEGLTDIFNRYDRAIILEDDIYTAPSFLDFMNDGLGIYQNDNIVKSIAGYMEPVKVKEHEPFFLTKGTSWGWATWSRVWKEMEWDPVVLQERLEKQPELISKFHFGGVNFSRMLNNQIEGKIDSWAVRFYTSCFLLNGLHLTPPESLVQNIGFGSDEGTHTNVVDDFYSKSKPSNKEYKLTKRPLIANENVHKLVKRGIIKKRLKRIFRIS